MLVCNIIFWIISGVCLPNYAIGSNGAIIIVDGPPPPPFVGANKSQWRKRDKPAKAAFLGHPSRLIGNSETNRQSFLCPSIRWLIDEDVKGSERSDNERYLSEPTSQWDRDTISDILIAYSLIVSFAISRPVLIK